MGFCTNPFPTTHGEIGTRLYSIWKGVKARCQTPTNTNYRHYGARGIKLCSEWQTYEGFRAWAMANGYHELRQIDRIDADGPYSPSNCRWVAPLVNAARKALRRDGSYMTDLRGALDEAEISAVRPAQHARKLFDGGGLYLFVGRSGRCSWRLKFRFAGKERLLVLGPYPLLSLTEARELREVTKGRLRRGDNPLAIKRGSETKARWRARRKMAENGQTAIPQN